MKNINGEKLGRLLALDLGSKRVGVAVSDENRISVSPLKPIMRSSWKHLVHAVAALVQRFDACGLVIGLPLNFDGSTGAAARAATEIAGKFALTLSIPVFLQDERLTSVEADRQLRQNKRKAAEVRALVDSESAAIVLRDFLSKAKVDGSVEPRK